MEKKNTKPNLRSFFEETTGAVDTVPAMIAKLRSSKMFPELPTWMDEVDTNGIVESDLPPWECLMLCNEQRGKNPYQKHPVHVVEALTVKKTVVVYPTKVDVIEDGQVLETLDVCRSIVVTNDKGEQKNVIAAAVTSTMISVETQVSRDGSMPTKWPIENKMQTLDLRALRDKLHCDEISATKGRSVLYETLISDPPMCAQVHTMSGEKLANYQPDVLWGQQMTKIAVENKSLPRGKKIEAKFVTMDKSSLKSVASLEEAYLMYDRNNAARGGNSGRGSLLAGYFLFETTKAIANKYSCVKDIINVMKNNDFKALMTATSSLNRDELRWLVANGITIIALNEEFPPYRDGKPGIYGSMPKLTKGKKGIKILRYLNFRIADYYPVMVHGTMTYPMADKYTAMLSVISNTEYSTIARVPMRASLESGKYSLLPSVDPSTMCVIVGYKVGKGYPLGDHVRRCSAAVYAKSMFHRTRVPFWVHDRMGADMRYSEGVLIPRTVEPKIKKMPTMSEYEADIGLRFVDKDPHADVTMSRVVPLSRTKDPYEEFYANCDANNEGLLMLLAEHMKLWLDLDCDDMGSGMEHAQAIYSQTVDVDDVISKLLVLNESLGIKMTQIRAEIERNIVGDDENDLSASQELIENEADNGDPGGGEEDIPTDQVVLENW